MGSMLLFLQPYQSDIFLVASLTIPSTKRQIDIRTLARFNERAQPRPLQGSAPVCRTSSRLAQTWGELARPRRHQGALCFAIQTTTKVKVAGFRVAALSDADEE